LVPESFPREKLQRHKADKPLAKLPPPVEPIRMGLVTSVNNYLDPKSTRSSRLTSQVVLTCICLSRRLFRVTLEISRAECNIDVTPVSTCVGVGGGRGRETKIKTKANSCGACYYSIMLDAHLVTSMADTDIDAVQKRKNAERIKQYRL
jgi:hypothetical protein